MLLNLSYFPVKSRADNDEKNGEAAAGVGDDGGEFKADYISDLEEDNESDEEVVVSDNQLSEQEEEEKDD